jgi:photosystem II stability/assembly factor-like uncharacterized protein/membrane-bound inhibitor of C-type lysozyme
MKKLFLILFVLSAPVLLSGKGNFIDNKGQFPENVLALHKGTQADVWIERDGITFDFYTIETQELSRKEAALERIRNGELTKIRKGHVVKLTFENAPGTGFWNAESGEDVSINYIGENSNVSGVIPSAKGTLKNIYPGIDLVVYLENGNFRYDFVVAAGADPGVIGLDFEGATDLKINNSGDIEFNVSIGTIQMTGLHVYQENEMKAINSSFTVHGENEVGFNFGDYDSSKPLTIDPLVIASYCGGTAEDKYNDIYVDNSYIYAVGYTYSSDYPTSVGAYQTSYNANKDVVISKFSQDGKQLLYSTYITGSGEDYATGVVVKDGIATVVGKTQSNTFFDIPQEGSGTYIYPKIYKGSGDGFIARLNGDGTELEYKTFFGGAGEDEIKDIIFDNSGNLILVGDTRSSNGAGGDGFPVKTCQDCAAQSTHKGDKDAFIIVFNPTGDTLLYSTYFGESGLENGTDIAQDSRGNIYIAGATESPGLPTSGTAFQSSKPGTFSGYVVKMNSTLTDYSYMTYFGGTGDWDDITNIYGVEVDTDFNIYIAGVDASENFPSTSGVMMESHDPWYWAGFVAKLQQGDTNAVFSTLVGGTDDDWVYDLELSSANEAIVTGYTMSDDFPISTDAEQSTLGGSQDAFIAVVNEDGTDVSYSTYFGGSDDEEGQAIFYDCEIFAAGYSKSTDMPTTSGAYQTSNAGDFDAWISKYSLNSDVLTLVAPAANERNINEYASFEVSGLNIGDTWKLQIATDSGFESIVTEQSFAGSIAQLTTALEKDTDYWWRARRVVEGFCGAWSTGRKFKTSRFDNEYNWTWSNPLPPLFDYRGIESGAGKLVAFGLNGLFAIENNASTWSTTLIPYDGIQADFTDASFPTASTGYFCGTDEDTKGIILKTTDGGESVSRIADVASGITSIAFTSETTGYYCDKAGDIYKTTDGGATWNAATLGTSTQLNKIDFYDADKGFACGYSGVVYYTTDAGANWSQATLPGTPGDLNDITSFDGTNIYTCGLNYSIYQSTDGGVNWTALATGSSILRDIVEVSGEVMFLGNNQIVKETSQGVWENTYSSLTNGDRVFTAGISYGGKYYAVGSEGVFSEIDTDGFVASEKTALGHNLKAIVAKDEKNVFAFGESVFKTTDGGDTWSDVGSAFSGTMIAGRFLYSGIGYASTNFRYFYKTTDDGTTWTQEDTGIDKDIYDMEFSDTQRGMLAMDNYVYLTTDGGTTWNIKYNANFNTGRDIDFANETSYFACGDIWKSTDDGDYWVKISTSAAMTDLHCVETKDNSKIFIGGDGGIEVSTDGGSTWAWSHQETGMVVTKIEMLDNNKAWAVTQGGLLLETIDGGTTWSRSGIGKAAGLKNLCVYNSVNVWAAGDNGSIVKSATGLDIPALTTQTIVLNERWNMISFYVNPIEETIEEIFGDKDVFLIKNGSGKIYLPDYGISQIDNFDFTEGYLVYMNSTDTLEIAGEYDITSNTPITLKKGWNMIHYPNDTAMPLTDALETVIDNGKLFLLKNGTGKIVLPGYGIYQITNMNPGEGYLIYMNEEESNFTFPVAP